MTMAGRICLVTGGTGGIGKATATALASKGATVVVVGRNKAKGEAAVADIRQASGNLQVELMLADFASLDSVRRLAAEFLDRYRHLHVLVNNAGAMYKQRTITADGFEANFGVNYLSPFLLTNLLLDRMKGSAPARIINVSSIAHAFPGLDLSDWQCERRSYNIMRSYGLSKLATILFTYELARRVEGTGVTANALHPGMVRTDILPLPQRGLFRSVAVPVLSLFIKSAEQGAETSIHLATDPALATVTGRYFVRKRARRSSRATYDEDPARELWDLSVQLTSL